MKVKTPRPIARPMVTPISSMFLIGDGNRLLVDSNWRHTMGFPAREKIYADLVQRM
jgi:hypothetical protein